MMLQKGCFKWLNFTRYNKGNIELSIFNAHYCMIEVCWPFEMLRQKHNQENLIYENGCNLWQRKKIFK